MEGNALRLQKQQGKYGKTKYVVLKIKSQD